MLFENLSSADDSATAPALSRRSLLGTFALAGIGMAAGTGFTMAEERGMVGKPRVSTPTSAGSSPAKNSAAINTSIPELPEEWRVHQGGSINEYLKFLKTLKLVKISPAQVIQAHAKEKGGVWNTLPPKQWWLRMGYTLRVVDRIAVAMNTKEVEVVSAYRHPLYNAHCAGAKIGSWHQANVACDVQFSESPNQVAHAARYLREKGLFKGGVGCYPSFTHIDTRGENTNWGA